MLIFEKSKTGRKCRNLPECDVPVVTLDAKDKKRSGNYICRSFQKASLADITQNWQRNHMV